MLRYPRRMLAILSQCVRMDDRNWIVNKETICLTSTSPLWSGEYVCQREWKRQYILDKIIKIIYVRPRTPTPKKLSICSTFRRNWSWIKISQIFGIFAFDWKQFLLVLTILQHDRAVKLSKSKVHVYSDSVIRLGRMHEQLQLKEVWRQHLSGSRNLLNNVIYQSRSSGNISEDTQQCSCVAWSKGWWKRTWSNLKKFEDRIIFVSMYIDIDWREAEKEICIFEFLRSQGVRKTNLWRRAVILRTRNKI